MGDGGKDDVSLSWEVSEEVVEYDDEGDGEMTIGMGCVICCVGGGQRERLLCRLLLWLRRSRASVKCCLRSWWL